MEKPLVSIVVVSYNHAHFLEENLNSIKAQTYPSIQLIVADDASKDNSIEVYENWLEKNNYPAIKNFHTKNTGLATTLNECIDLIEGKYVKFIAADDYLHPEAIEKCVNKLEELGNDYGMVFTDTWAINNKSEITKDIADYNANQYLNKEELREKMDNLMNKFHPISQKMYEQSQAEQAADPGAGQTASPEDDVVDAEIVE